MLRKAFAAGLVIFSFAALATAQEANRFDASIAWGGVFGKSEHKSIGNVTVSPTSSPLLLGTFRVRFNHVHGIEVNIAHTSDSQIFIISPDQYRVQASVLEYSAAYVFSPLHFHKIEPFLFAGGGALRFNPGNMYIDGFQSAFGATRQTSMAFLYGGGIDYSVWRPIGLRVQYRGLIYKEPTFHLTQFFTGVNGHMPEASIGIVLKF